jgi:hypothetical protein
MISLQQPVEKNSMLFRRRRCLFYAVLNGAMDPYILLFLCDILPFEAE